MTIRKLFAVFATAGAAIAAGPAGAAIYPDLVLPPPKADLVVSSYNADTFTVTNLPCAASEVCMGGPGASSANNFRVRIYNGYFTFQGLTPWPHWNTWTTNYTLSLAPGASYGLPFDFPSGLCGYVTVVVDVWNEIPERNEGNNSWGLARPPALICR
jgi:hypothetical protein